MAHDRNRRRRTNGNRSEAASKPARVFSAAELDELLAKAAQEPKAHVALEMFRTALEACRSAAKELASEDQERRYADALFGVASILWRIGLLQEASEHFHELCRADPEDRHCGRYWMITAMFYAETYEKLKEALEVLDEPTAVWRYAQALYAFRMGGDTEDARSLLEEASRLDARFLDYLLGNALIDLDRPIRFGPDQDETTNSMAALFLPTWRDTPGAATWARRVLRIPLHKLRDEPAFSRDELCGLPRRDVTWQVGLRPVTKEECPLLEDRGWVVGIASLGDWQLLRARILEDEPTPEAVWPKILSAFRQPEAGEAHRPVRLEVPQSEFCRAWHDLLAEISVECVVEPDPEPVTQMLDDFVNNFNAHLLPPLDEKADPRQFPQTGETWQADFFHMPLTVSNEAVGVERPWAALVIDKQSRALLCIELIPAEPTPEQLWEILLRTMAHPGMHDPARPSVVELSDSDCYDFLKPKLSQCGVDCALVDELSELHDFCRFTAKRLREAEKSGLAHSPGVTEEQMESFYYAAARYFEAAPWKRAPEEIPIQIHCRGLSVGTMYVIVLGRAGMTQGLTFYRGWKNLLAFLQDQKSGEEMWGFSVIFGEESIMTPADLDLVERRGWPIVTPEAYPSALRYEPGRQPQAPTSEQLACIESCLRILPDFIDCGRKAKTYELVTHGRQLKMRMCWRLPRPGPPPETTAVSG